MRNVILGDVIRDAIETLSSDEIDNPALDARLLIAHALGLDRAQLLSQSERILAIDELRRIHALIERRKAREPVTRILGEREFWGLTFGLNEATLDPRPDSEALVDAALKTLRERRAPRILDLGTGTGCLLLALLHELPNATGLGIDIAPRAVEQAQMNAKKLELADRAKFEVGNWVDNIAEKFDTIVSNPPYIPSDDIASLMPEVRKHDPRRALDGGPNGLDVYRYLAPRLPRLLKKDGFVVLEVGQGQADDVTAICRGAELTGITKYRDLNGIERCVMGWKG